MKNTLTFMLGILAFLLVVGFASSAVNIVNTSAIPSQLNNSQTYTFAFNVSYDTSGDKNVTFDFNPKVSQISYSVPSKISLNNSNKWQIVSYNITADSSYTGATILQFLADITVGTDDSISFNTNFVDQPSSSGTNYLNICPTNKFNNSGAIEIRAIEDQELDNADEWEWKPLDNIEIEVRLRNNADDDLEYDLQLLFFDGSSDVSDEIVSDEDDLEIDGFDVDEGDTEDAVFSFSVDGQVEEGNYDLYVRVTDEDGNCYVEKADNDIEIDKNSRQVVVKEVEAEKSFTCGQTVDLTARIANIGSEDEDQVKVVLYNKDLGLNIFRELSDVDEGDTATAFFSFNIPQNAKEQNYRLTLSTEYDYDDDDRTYDEISDTDDDLVYTISVLGGCVDISKPTVSANLKSSANVGEEMIVEVSVRNNAPNSTSFLLYVENYQSWADSASLSSSSVNLNSGQSGTSEITLVPNKEGQQTFVIKVVYNGNVIEQPVTVNVSKKQGIFSNVFGNLSNNFVGLLIAGIIILVVIIVIVLVIKAIVSRE